MSHTVELLWFSDCPNHPAARAMLEGVIAEVAPGTPIRAIDATDPATAASVRFPGSPTIRVNGRDVDPGYVDPGDYTPRLSSVPNGRRAPRLAGTNLDRGRVEPCTAKRLAGRPAGFVTDPGGSSGLAVSPGPGRASET